MFGFKPTAFGVGIFTFGVLTILGAAMAFALPQVENERVERFLQALEREKDLVFIRNGSEYTAQRAVGHLRRKLKSAKDKLSSAEEFIDNVAAKSIMSGKPYLIRRPGGQNEEAGPYFHKLLTDSD
jgi:hypothetical protein